MDHVIKKYQLNRVRSEVLGRLGDDYFEHIGCQHQLGTQSLNCELCAHFFLMLIARRYCSRLFIFEAFLHHITCDASKY